MAEPLVELRHVTFGYEREPILRDVSLAIHPRDYLAIIGPNGGGKTTLLKIILGLLRPWSGEVIVRVPRGRMGYVPQFSTFDRHFPLKVEEVVLMGRWSHRGLFRPYTREDRAAVRRVLERLHLTSVARLPIGALSGGQMQRTLIARAVVSEPAILFLDEPLASVDAESREVVSRLLSELNQRIPVVIVTHDITAIAPFVKQIACVNRRLFYHGAGEITREMLEEVYGCPVELIAHGIPHRVLPSHEERCGPPH
ncbi:MAG: metal ABC transporter ATP-binding protein [Gammaproteobacteria bacterium]|nr:MAG: metal ABC transporter ATP-binding protein [Gammaproteobacteria bacterium]